MCNCSAHQGPHQQSGRRAACAARCPAMHEHACMRLGWKYLRRGARTNMHELCPTVVGVHPSGDRRKLNVNIQSAHQASRAFMHLSHGHPPAHHGPCAQARASSVAAATSHALNPSIRGMREVMRSCARSSEQISRIEVGVQRHHLAR
jgi:hypothetical protein